MIMFIWSHAYDHVVKILCGDVRFDEYVVYPGSVLSLSKKYFRRFNKWVL